MDAKGQVSFEYLMMVAFAVIMVMAAAAIALNLSVVADTAKLQIENEREATIEMLMS